MTWSVNIHLNFKPAGQSPVVAAESAGDGVATGDGVSLGPRPRNNFCKDNIMAINIPMIYGYECGAEWFGWCGALSPNLTSGGQTGVQWSCRTDCV